MNLTDTGCLKVNMSTYIWQRLARAQYQFCKRSITSGLYNATSFSRNAAAGATGAATHAGATDRWALWTTSRTVSRVRCYASVTQAEEEAVREEAREVPHPEPLSGAEIRERFLRFYESRGHQRVSSSSLIPEDPTVLLTIAGMLQFKPIFLGQAARQYPRATSTQKCIRTNDIENVGVTKRHHTFFEMLGNFSFGDYFKEEAIKMAWQLSTQELGIPPERIWVSVYEEDEEAERIWLEEVGVPRERVKRMGADDNFWASGPTGPCGPCSELYYDFYPELGTEGASLEDDSRFIEFYNLVFMQSNRGADGSLSPLAAQNIDTGMGLERVAQILQGVPNNYETDLLFPLLAEAARLAGIDYSSAPEKTKTSLKVIADHIRACVYLISDGVTPSNVGRGYVLRRLIRRVVLKGRLLGITETFTPSVARVAIQMSGPCDPSVLPNQDRILTELAREEERFSSTLETGEKLLEKILEAAKAKGSPVSGQDAFLLYDTYGFPLEITQEAAAEQNIAVDARGFEEEMAAQKQRSKEAAKTLDLTQGAALGQLLGQIGSTSFLGYSQLAAPARVVAILADGRPVDVASPGEEVELLLDQTPFYGESGGQVGDWGFVRGVPDPATPDPAASSSGAVATLEVRDTQKAAGGAVHVHRGRLSGASLRVGQPVEAEVDARRRAAVAAHHTATHLLQAALRRALGADVAQQGSLVEPDRLRFDFNLPRAMTAEEISEVERLINVWVAEDHVSQTRVLPLAEAKAAGAIAMFGEKYDEAGVRVVDVPGVSMELCGGTHVTRTAQIGGFKVLSESGIASGVRRIEAVVGPALVAYLDQVDRVVKSLASQLKVRPEELPARVAAMTEEIRAAQKEVEGLKGALAVASANSLVGEAITGPNKGKLLVARLDGVEGKALQDAAADLQAKLGDPAAVFLVSAVAEGKVSMAAAFSAALTKGGQHAGKFVGGIAQVCGGKGGGRPNLAQAGAKDTAKIPEALEAARDQLLALL